MPHIDAREETHAEQCVRQLRVGVNYAVNISKCDVPDLNGVELNLVHRCEAIGSGRNPLYSREIVDTCALRVGGIDRNH